MIINFHAVQICKSLSWLYKLLNNKENLQLLGMKHTRHFYKAVNNLYEITYHTNNTKLCG